MPLNILRPEKPKPRLKISAPIPMGPTSLTGFDADAPPNTASTSSGTSTSPGPSNLAWLSMPNGNGGHVMTRVPIVPPHGPSPEAEPIGISRTVSLPFPGPLPRLRMNSSTHSLDARGAFGPPSNKPLSPIVEQDYFSPESLSKSMPLPDVTSSSESSRSEITRPSPAYTLSITMGPSPFLSRPVRTGSQSSSRSASTPTPTLPPLDLHPPFPGPHPSAPDGQPHHLRRALPPIPLRALPTIPGSVEGGSSELASLHVDSYFTASDGDEFGDEEGEVKPGEPWGEKVWKGKERDDDEDEEEEDQSFEHSTPIRTSPPLRSPPSASESFIVRRWDRFASFYTPFLLRPPSPKPTESDFPSRFTPAFWAFWVGFLFPVLWLLGGWHFTTFGEQPPKMTFWEFYFDGGYWRVVYCGFCRGGRGKKGRGKGKKELVLPRWVALDEKQAYRDQVTRMNERKGSMKRRGFLFGYPFVPRPPGPGGRGWMWRGPLWFFDQLYGVKLVEVQGRGETGRRMFDPWIQRCRYAVCYALVGCFLGALGAATYLLVVNIREVDGEGS